MCTVVPYHLKRMMVLLTWLWVVLCKTYTYTSGIVASAPDFERADEGSILTAGKCFKSGKSECNNSGYKLTGLT